MADPYARGGEPLVTDLDALQLAAARDLHQRDLATALFASDMNECEVCGRERLAVVNPIH